MFDDLFEDLDKEQQPLESRSVNESNMTDGADGMVLVQQCESFSERVNQSDVIAKNVLINKSNENIGMIPDKTTSYWVSHYY